jgi:RNA polymerase sigma-70 factor (ECF subfamily)
VSAPPETSVYEDAIDEWPRAASSSGELMTDVGRVSRPEVRQAASTNEVFELVYRQMRSLAGRRPDFDDLVQIAAEQVLRSLSSFEGRSKFSTWTYRICYVTVLRHERWYRRWLRRFTLTDRGELEGHAPAHNEPSLEEIERAVRLRQAVDQLSPKRRTVVVLHDLEGQSVESIARIVAANPLTVRSRLRDGRRDLARILAADPYFGDQACCTEENEQ